MHLTASQPLAVSMGDPAGIGPEVIVKSWAGREDAALPPFFAVGSPAAFAAVGHEPLAIITAPEEAVEAFGRALPIIPIAEADEIVPGQPTVAGAAAALQALEIACGLTRGNAAAALVTAPVSKAGLYGVGFDFPGQTEFVAERCGIARENAVMMLAGPSLKTVPITVHLPIAQVPAALTTELIVARARVTHRSLQRDFGIEAPRLVLAGLNPHAGEDGAIGREEIEVMRPAVEHLAAEGIEIVGPLSGDTLFHASARAKYDAALCPFHDQALIPIKTLHFEDGVNLTLGLPIVRTSPDHGTAFSIAGRGIADPGAMTAAIRMGAECAIRRQQTR